jgi:hypothetical protein
MNRKLFVFFLTIILGASISAQDDQRWYVGKPIETLNLLV